MNSQNAVAVRKKKICARSCKEPTSGQNTLHASVTEIKTTVSKIASLPTSADG
jgi:hypothetical protein